MILKGIARGMDKITMLLSFPSDEVGNNILDEDVLDKSKYNLSSVISEDEYKETFSSFIHPFTGINMVDFYRDLIESENCKVEFVFANDPKEILNYTKDVLVCDIDGDIYKAYMSEYDGWRRSEDFENIKNVVAWMPLPEAYKA